MLGASVPALAVDPSAGVVPYWNVTVVGAPNGSTDPDTVAVVLVIALAEPVLAVGGSSSETLPIAFAPRSLNHKFPSGPVVS